jgi:hypothetical protein
MYLRSALHKEQIPLWLSNDVGGALFIAVEQAAVIHLM